MKKLFFTITLLSCSLVYSQDNELTLEDAILGRWSKFAPERIPGLQWVKDANKFCFIDNNNLIIEDLTGNKDIITIDELNLHLKSDSVIRFPRVAWNTNSIFRFKKGNNYYTYNIHTKELINEVEIENYAEHQDYSSKSAAVAYTLNNNLYIQDSKKHKHIVTADKDQSIVNGQAVHRYEFGISKGTFWSNSGKYLAFYRKDESMVTDYPLVNTNTRIAEENIIKYPMAGMKSHHVSLGIFNLNTEKTIYINTGEPKEQYLTNITWGPNDEFIYIAVLNRDQNHLKLNKYSVSNGEFITTLFEEKHDKYVQPLHPMIFIEGNNNEFLWRSERDGYDHFYRYNIEGKLLNQVTKGDWVVKDFLGFNGNSIIITGTYNNALETVVYKSTIKAPRSTIISSKEGVHKAFASSNGRFIIDTHQSLTNPGITEIYEHTGKEIKILLKSDDPFTETNIAQTDIYTIKAEDGTLLNCRMIKPSNFNPSKIYPVLIYVYNGPGVQLIYNSNLASAPLWMHYLSNTEEYIVFTIDGRGSENRGREFEQVTFRNLGDVEMRDQLKGVEHLKSLKYIDENRIALHGWSYGGFMTTNLMCTYPDAFSCGIAGGPVIDWKFYEVMYTERFMDTPQTNPEGYENTSLLNKAKNLKGDLLMIHGTDDDVVVWQHSLAFVQKCVDEGVQLDYFPYPGHPHNVRGKDRVHLMRKVIDYVINHNR